MNSNNLLSELTSDTVKVGGSIDGQTLVYNQTFPLVFEPADNNVNFVLLQEYFLNKHKLILQAASEFGAVMFKGFDLKCPEEFASVLYKSGLKEANYIGGAAVRKIIVGTDSKNIENIQILTTNESPPSESIPFHHELAQTPNPPSHICFFSQVKAATGGSTPIIRSDLVFDWVKTYYPELVFKFETGVRYIRRVPEIDDPSSAIGRSWKSMFKVETIQEAEASMTEQEYDYEWIKLDNGLNDCKISSKVLPAIRVSTNGNKTFYNQVLAAYTGWVDNRNKFGEAVRFSNGEEIPSDFIKSLEQFINENCCVYTWEEGQFVIIDNSVTYHSRQSFTGRRTVLAAIANGVKTPDIDQVAFTLKNGDRMPAQGLGLWKIPNEETARVVYEAFKIGYKLLDSACDYGNEKEVGEGIKKAIDKGVITRKDVWITSKLWNTYHRKEHVKEACLKTLNDLGLDFLDLYLVHFPIALKFVPFDQRYPPGWNFSDSQLTQPDMIEDNVPFSETWSAMEELVREGLVRNIGVCNMGTSMLRDLLNYCKIKPSVLQVEMHPYNTQEKLLKFCRLNGITVTAYSNLGAGSYVQLGVASYEDSCLNDENILKIAIKYSKSPAQIVLRWGIQRGTAIIPKTTSSERLKENFNLGGFNLTDQEMKSISKLNKNKRFNDPGDFCEAAFKTFFPIYD